VFRHDNPPILTAIHLLFKLENVIFCLEIYINLTIIKGGSSVKKALKNSTVITIFSICSIIFLIGTIFSFIVNSYYNQKISKAQENRFELTSNANLFMSGSANLTNQVRAYAATGIQEFYDNYLNEVNTVKSRERGLSAMQEIGITEEEQDMIDEMSAISNKLVPLEENAMQQTREGDKEAAVNYVYGSSYNSSIAQIDQLKNDFLVHLNERTAQEIADLNEICAVLNQVVWIIICITVILQILSSIYNQRKVIHPVIAIEKAMQEIACGNLHSEFNLTPDTSEIGLLVDSIHSTKKTLTCYIEDISEKLTEMAKGNMNQCIELEYIGDFRPIQNALTSILGALNHTLGEISNASVKVAIEAQQVAGGSQNLAQGATQQAASVEELSATINDLSEKMNRVAQNAQNARSISNDASGVLHLCSQKMDELVDAMKQISNASTEIKKIIDTIESIAFQTNILSLNAAVESARVGVAGKGFAVVAGEVRSLANKSQEASKNTTELIERTMEAIKNGTHIVDDTAQTLLQVVDGAKQSTDYVDSIADASKEQSMALEQLVIGINQIADVVQNTSATSQESAAASIELNEQASLMQRLTNSFKLRAN